MIKRWPRLNGLHVGVRRNRSLYTRSEQLRDVTTCTQAIRANRCDDELSMPRLR